MSSTSSGSADGRVPPGDRAADVLAIQDLAISYAHAVDDRDWARFEGLFLPDGRIDYRASGGIEGRPAEVAAWMPDALAAFTWCMHSISTHEIRFTGEDTASGRVHLFNRNGVLWQGQGELCDIGGLYLDRYRLVDGSWRFAERVETVLYVEGGAFADVVRSISTMTRPGSAAGGTGS